VERTLIKDTIDRVGQKVLINGWVSVRRDHGKIVFLDVWDRSGTVQVVCNDCPADTGDAVEITGLVKTRPEKLINQKLETGKIELEAQEIKVLAKSETYPFDMGKEELDLELPTLLDHRSLTLKHPKVQEIFKVQETILEAFRKTAKELGCTEIIVPTISASATEGGAEVFFVDYFGHKCYLTQSPQLYKQMLVPVFERVFTISKAYRAEPSVTTRHLTEATQMDCEFGFVNFETLLNLLEKVGIEMLKAAETHQSVPKVSYGKIPRLKMREVQEIIYKEFGRDVRNEKDLGPQDEIDICAWALKNYRSDFVTVTHYPTKKRAFYTMPDPVDPEYSLSYDLLFRGMEILSGSQRVNDYGQLVAAIKDRGMDPKNFEMYLMAFEYGMPPEGGFSFGLERLTMKALELVNVREASLYPRDMERVDFRLCGKKVRDVFGEIRDLLDSNKIGYQVFEHEAVFTSEQAAKVRGTELKQGAKALVMFGDDKPLMVVLPANLKVDTTQFKKENKVKDLRMASAEEVEKLTSTKVGAVPPFGNLFNLPLFVDKKMGENEEVAFNAGEHTKSIKMKYADFEKVTNPVIGNYSSAG
jgi:nondiscriminating aspartyl-tRNA synthetase